MSRDLYSLHFTMLRATVLLCLVTNAVLTQSLPTTDTAQGTDPIDVDYPSDGSQLHEGSINDTLSGIPTCSADYSRMSIADRKVFQNVSPKPHAICVRSDGFFVATILLPNPQHAYFFDPCGWVKAKIILPGGTTNGLGCVFTPNYLFYSITPGNQILQFNSGGIYMKVFAGGATFLRLAAQGNVLYTSIRQSREIRAYNTFNGILMYRFFTSNGLARGLAFDRNGNLHVTTFSNVVELFTPQGQKLSQKILQLAQADGIAVDSNYYRIIADRGTREVRIFNEVDTLIRRIPGFVLPVDVALGNRCTCLMVADLDANAIFLL